jgi:hypothetical protein
MYPQGCSAALVESGYHRIFRESDPITKVPVDSDLQLRPTEARQKYQDRLS